jgi:hypothetical protein
VGKKDFWIGERTRFQGCKEKFGQMGRKGGGDGAIGEKADIACAGTESTRRG